MSCNVRTKTVRGDALMLNAACMPSRRGSITVGSITGVLMKESHLRLTAM